MSLVIKRCNMSGIMCAPLLLLLLLLLPFIDDEKDEEDVVEDGDDKSLLSTSFDPDCLPRLLLFDDDVETDDDAPVLDAEDIAELRLAWLFTMLCKRFKLFNLFMIAPWCGCW